MKNTQAKNTQTFRTQLLQKLEDGSFHSGEMLANEFHLSRSAISNHIKALNKLGLDIYSVKGRGYKLATGIELLSQNKILAALSASNRSKALLIQVENLVTSTNDIVKAKSQETQDVGSGYCCLAEAQSAGRGRRGRTWVSPYASSLYFSMLWRFASGYQAMAGLSLMVGVVVNETLKSLGLKTCQLKWPNDIYYDHQKLAGILIEVEGQVGGSTSAIIGIGVNIHLPSKVQGIDQAFTDLHSISEYPISRNNFAAALIQNLWEALPIFEKEGMAPFMPKWQAADLYYQKEVKLLVGEKSIMGISRGIDPTGALLLDIKGNVQAFHGGEISVRPA
ncbi:MAG: BirA family biotin operon repressor/biotin-[acetyl-CoA-carboxylase] ligase [Glaciecola sp.]|jgi:BirA family biotin operon repressor/biotin-[acetyl-CoA-carboxylase] ligase